MQPYPLTGASASTPVFSSSFFSSSSSSRPTTREGPPPDGQQQPTKGSTKDRKPSFGRRGSFSTPRRRGNSNAASSNAVVTDATAPPALPDYALAAAAKVVSRDGSGGLGVTGGPIATFIPPAGAEAVRSPTSPESFSRMLTRTATGQSSTGATATAGASSMATTSGGTQMWQQHEAALVHQHVTDVANKRISTLDYLRKAHEGRIYWLNTYLFDKTDLQRMPYFDPRKLARKATNYLLLGLSLPVVADLYSSSPGEFLRSLSILLSEFDAFQQLHGDSTARARLPTMFRRPGVKTRRSTSASDVHSAGSETGGAGGGMGVGVPAGQPTPSVMNFAAAESDLLPGEEYTHLLTPSLPFEPDYFETFATLCDVLIDCYQRLLTLVATPRDCSAAMGEAFNKVDAKVRKIIVQGVVKEFEDHSRQHIKTEVASIGKVVLGGLM